MDRQRPDTLPNPAPDLNDEQPRREGESVDDRTDELPAYPPAVAVAMGARQAGVTGGVGLAEPFQQESQSHDEREEDAP